MALASYTESVRGQGLEPGAVDDRHRIPVGRRATGGGPRDGAGDEVVHLERVLLADGERVGLESSYLPKHRFPELLGEFDPTGSLYAFLQAFVGHLPAGHQSALGNAAGPGRRGWHRHYLLNVSRVLEFGVVTTVLILTFAVVMLVELLANWLAEWSARTR